MVFQDHGMVVDESCTFKVLSPTESKLMLVHDHTMTLRFMQATFGDVSCACSST